MKRFLGLAPLALLAACGSASGDEAAGEETTPVATVRTAPAALGATADTIEAYGLAEPGPASQGAMSIQAEATMVRVVAPSGTAVKAGQVVAILTPSANTRADTAKAQSDAASANAALARALRLRKDGLVSDADVETARAAAVTANASRASAVQRSGTLVLRAPISGTVQGLNAKPGDLLAAGTTVATIGSQGDLRAHLGVDPALALRIHPGQLASVQTIDGAKQFATTVQGVDPQVDATTRQAAVFAHLPDGETISAGTPLRASIRVGSASSGITIPYDALLDDGGKTFVFVVRSGVAKQVDVAPGNSSGDRIAILKGLNAGDRVVVEGGTALEDGMKVREADQAGAAK